LRIINYAFVTSNRWAIKLSEDAGGHVFCNSILFGSSSSLSVGSVALSSNNNVVDNSFSADNEATTIKLSTWRAKTGQDAASQTSTANAAFSGAASGDYSLSISSPARDSGSATLFGIAAPTADILGIPRRAGAAFDAGAYERQ